MKFELIDWLLVAAWAFFLALVGPFLISARDTILVLSGFVLFIGLVVFTVKRVRHFASATKTTENQDA